MSNPVLAYINTFSGSGGTGESASITFSFSMTAGYQAIIPIKCIAPTNLSAGPEVTVYRSTDGGATYETQGTLSLVFNRVPAATSVKDLIINDPGMYLISVLGGGSGVAATFSYQFGATAQILTAYV